VGARTPERCANLRTETPPAKRRYVKPSGKRRGLLIVHTGDGKGKTTAAIGLAVRAVGRGKSVRFFQFMKVGAARFGEHRALEQLGLKLEGLGDGFSWKSKDLNRSEHFLVVLDEMTYPLLYGWLDLDPVLAALRSRPAQVHVVITGRRCPQEIIEIADTVTEMTLVKHAFAAGIPAQRGIEH
jgi:cob(I)alamin adenosyltransferase